MGPWLIFPHRHRLFLLMLIPPHSLLAARHRPDDQERFFALGHGFGQGIVRRLMGQIPLTGKKPNEWPTPMGEVVPDRPAQHGIPRFQAVQHPAHRHRAGHIQPHFPIKTRQGSQMRWKDETNHRFPLC